MNISFETPDKINGLMTITVEEADYKENVEKTLKEYRKRANLPGFRPGMVPMGLIKRQYGTSVKMEAINKFVGEQIYKYVKDNNIQMLGEPLPNLEAEAVDLEREAPYTFKFDIAVAPEFKAELTSKDAIDYYTINVDDKLIDQQVDMFASRAGNYEKVDSYEGNDMLKGDLRELEADGSTKEGGIEVSEDIVMPAYIKNEDQKKLFEGAKLGDVITFNPRKAYESDAELAAFLKVDKAVLGFADAVKSEEEFRARIASEIQAQLVGNSDWKFLQDVLKYMEQKVGALTFPDALLKRIMQQNNKDKDADYVEQNYEGSIKELAWHLIKEQLVNSTEIKVDDNDVKAAAREAARAQFAQYGMNNVPDDYLDNYATEMLKKEENVQGYVDRAIDKKLTAALKDVVKLNEKTVSLDEFNKLMAE